MMIKGIKALLNDFVPASHDQLTDSLARLVTLVGHGIDIDLAHSVRFIDHDISIAKGDMAGEIISSTNTLGLVLSDNKGQPVSLAVVNPSQPKSRPFIIDDSVISGFVMGNMSHDTDWWIADSLEHGIDLLQAFYEIGQVVTVIACLNGYKFADTVAHFAEVKQVKVNTTILGKDKLISQLAGVNALAVITPLLSLHECDDMAQVSNELNDAEIIDLQAQGWGEIEPLDDDSTPATPYPIDAFTGVLRGAVEAIAYHAQVPTAMVGQCVLGALSTIGQRYVKAPIGHTHKPASLFLITEGDSGSGKSFASGLSHHSIYQWDKRIYQTYIELQREWQVDLDSLKGKERKEYLATVPKPKNETMLVQDSTIEAVLDQFILDDKANLSWTSDDAGQFFNGHSMKSDTAGNAIASLAKLWDGAPVSRHRSQRGNNPQYKTNAYDVCLTMDMQGQRIILETALTDPMLVQQGFLARALLACPDSLQGKRVWNTKERLNNDPYDDPRLKEYWSRCDILLDPLPNNIKTDATGKEIRHDMPFADIQARQSLADFQQRVENRQAKGKGKAYEFLKAFASRMAQNASRIATLMAFFDCHQSVSTDYLQRAFMLVEYSTSERLRYLEIKTNDKSDTQKLVDWLVKKVNGKKYKLNRTYVANSCPMPMQRSNRLLQQELDKLEQAGYIRQEQEGRKKVILVNPNLCK